MQARVDDSEEWLTIGRVKKPATATVPTFAASRFTPPSTVAAIATHGIRLRDGSTGETPKGISIQPKEFERPPTGFGGHVPGPSGIYTDIPAGEALFRELSPVVGDSVLLERGGSLVSLPADWKPSRGDVIQIHRAGRTMQPVRVEFENWQGGSVEACFPDGKRSRIARVSRPVTGIGRFDATGYTGPATLNTNHPGVITISTAPASRPVDEGLPPETRGGFQIQPARHAATQYPMPQAMVVEPLEGEDPLEGKWPLFSGWLGLGDGTVLAYWKDSGGKRHELPIVTGKVDEGLRVASGPDWTLVLEAPMADREQTREWIQQTSVRVQSKETHRLAEPTSIFWKPGEPVPPSAAFAVFRMGEDVLMVSNQRPFTLRMDAEIKVHELSVEFLSDSGAWLATRKANLEVTDTGVIVRER